MMNILDRVPERGDVIRIPQTAIGVDDSVMTVLRAYPCEDGSIDLVIGSNQVPIHQFASKEFRELITYISRADGGSVETT